MFCDWFKPISTWTFPSTTVSGGRRRRRSLESFAYHSMPYTERAKPSSFKGYFYEPPLTLRKRRRQRENSFSRRILKTTSPTVKSETLARILRLLKVGLKILIQAVTLFRKK